MATSNDILAQNKLIILYLLKKMNMPVSLAHIQSFTLSTDCMDYFSLSSYLAELKAGKQVNQTKENNQTCYEITQTGMQTLSYFENLLSENLKQSIQTYVKANKPRLKDALDISAVFSETDKDNYSVNLSLAENSEEIISVSLSSLSKAQAKKICANWKNNTSDLYLSTLKKLLGDN